MNIVEFLIWVVMAFVLVSCLVVLATHVSETPEDFEQDD